MEGHWKAMDGLKVSATGVRQAFTKRSLVRSRTPLGSAEWLAACGARASHNGTPCHGPCAIYEVGVPHAVFVRKPVSSYTRGSVKFLDTRLGLRA